MVRQLCAFVFVVLCLLGCLEAAGQECTVTLPNENSITIPFGEQMTVIESCGLCLCRSAEHDNTVSELYCGETRPEGCDLVSAVFDKDGK